MIAITHWGTTDVDNYGDLVFPLILEKELRSRLGEVQLGLAAPFGGIFPADKSRRVDRIVRFEEPGFYRQIQGSSGIVLGGGDIIRVDEGDLIDLYGTVSDAGYGRFNRLFLHDLAKLARIFPVYWNAVGVPHEFDPAQHLEVRRATQNIRYLSVRDELSKKRLESAGVAREVEVVPDTALLLNELFSEDELEQRIQGLRSEGAFPAQGRTLTFQMPLMAESIANEAAAVLSRLKVEFPDIQIVLLPVGTCRNDLPMFQRIKSRLGAKVFVIDRETSILDVVAVISHSDCFAGASLHGNLTAAAYALENVFINIPECAASKNREYARMLGRESCLVEDLTQLYPTLRSLYAGKRPVDVSVLSALKKRSSSHFERLASEIAAEIAAEAGKKRSVCLAEVERIHSELCESLRADSSAKAEKQRIKTESRIQEAEARVLSAAESAERMEELVVQRETEARKIQESRGWRLLSRYGRFKHRVLLPAARRLGL